MSKVEKAFITIGIDSPSSYFTIDRPLASMDRRRARVSCQTIICSSAVNFGEDPSIEMKENADGGKVTFLHIVKI